MTKDEGYLSKLMQKRVEGQRMYMSNDHDIKRKKVSLETPRNSSHNCYIALSNTASSHHTAHVV